MIHVMFDIDGTLLESYELDFECFVDAVKEVTGLNIDTNWASYEHVTDVGILKEFFEKNKIENNSEIVDRVKKSFLKKIEKEIVISPIKQVLGASEFISKLKSLDNVVISFATGGWFESAILKLKSAGIDFSNVSIASSNDHYSRIGIMRIAEKRATDAELLNFTYFGDGIWDLKACKELGINFVLVGDKVEHSQQVDNFAVQDNALAYIGL
jgi:phosphoglycolate phosphatase-like HAD superfamily hydrolase